ncbi:reverse transcriptase domain-containing protein [Xenorhabdus sp. XENO-10]|uniref:Reverse transcriptase domain-containing protein n=1 Tax=Xenorhabdus yunnanensis TaxID=3025878 RepID=A0ABT5LGZ7_9GAMM|nr:reverse transcriptase domain-containing protein [Xenorhabdus yunnanensis]MDC9590382.1 reverse transcriptase domain-containing protein [Xenorhabdus yunnanensis]
MQKHYPQRKWCRYADDGLVHCQSEYQAREMRAILEQRFRECGLELHPDKTRIAYCKDEDRKGKYEHTCFDFLGYTFRPRWVKNTKRNTMFVSFTPAVSKTTQKAMRFKLRKLKIRLVRWAKRKFKALRRYKTRAAEFLERIAKKHPWLFAHWRAGMTGSFV